MTTTVQQIIEAAIARSTANDAGKLTVDGELIAYLNRNYQSICARMALAGGDNWTAKASLSFAGSPPSAALPTDIIDIVRMETGAGARTYLIPIRDKDRTWVLAPAVYRQGNTIVSRASTGDPVGGDTWGLWFKDAPATLAALSSTLDVRFPVRFEPALIVDLAVYMAVKDENRNPTQLQALLEDLKVQNALVTAIIGDGDSAQSTPHPIQGTAAQTGGTAN